MEYDPVLESHAILAGGESAAPAAPAGEPMGLPMWSAENVSRQVPMILAAGALAGVGALFAMRVAGIRFAFGANIGGA
jgi:hypothetical protein